MSYGIYNDDEPNPYAPIPPRESNRTVALRAIAEGRRIIEAQEQKENQ